MFLSQTSLIPLRALWPEAKKLPLPARTSRSLAARPRTLRRIWQTLKKLRSTGRKKTAWLEPACESRASFDACGPLLLSHCLALARVRTHPLSLRSSPHSPASRWADRLDARVTHMLTLLMSPNATSLPTFGNFSSRTKKIVMLIMSKQCKYDKTSY